MTQYLSSSPSRYALYLCILHISGVFLGFLALPLWLAASYGRLRDAGGRLDTLLVSAAVFAVALVVIVVAQLLSLPIPAQPLSLTVALSSLLYSSSALLFIPTHKADLPGARSGELAQVAVELVSWSFLLSAFQFLLVALQRITTVDITLVLLVLNNGAALVLSLLLVFALWMTLEGAEDQVSSQWSGTLRYVILGPIFSTLTILSELWPAGLSSSWVMPSDAASQLFQVGLGLAIVQLMVFVWAAPFIVAWGLPIFLVIMNRWDESNQRDRPVRP
jgi:hypothetical protein